MTNFILQGQKNPRPFAKLCALPTLWFSQKTSQFVYSRGVPIVHAPARNVAWWEALRWLKSRTFPIVIILPPWGSDTTLFSWSIWTDPETLLLDKIQRIPQDRLRIISYKIQDKEANVMIARMHLQKRPRVDMPESEEHNGATCLETRSRIHRWHRPFVLRETQSNPLAELE